MHGGRIRSVGNFIIEHKLIAFIASIASIGGLVIALVTLL
jgi:hypothetical protein